MQKWIQVTDGTDKVARLAKKHKVKTAFGTDALIKAYPYLERSTK